MSARTGAGAWLRGHRGVVSTLVASTAVVAVVAVSAVAATGYEAREVSLDDGSVWLTSELHQATGRANPAIGELDTALRLESGSLDVAQSGDLVVVSELGGGEGRLIDPATASVTDTFPLPVGDVAVQLSGDRALIGSRTTGEVWIVPAAQLAGFDPTTPPDLTLGTGGQAQLTADGRVVAVSAATGGVFVLDPDAPVSAAASLPIAVDPDDELQITALGDRWAVLDSTAGELLTAEAVWPLGATVAAGETAWLQAPAAEGESVLVATAEQLVEVSLRDGSTTVRSTGHTGTAAAPVQLDGCSFAAWSDGRSWTRCASADGTTSGGSAPDSTASDGTESTRTGSSPADDLVFRTNGTGGVLLGDRVTGRAWDPRRGDALIDDWAALLPDTAADDLSTETVTDQPVQADPTQRPPVAVDDELGARPGRSTVLPVLLNDYDPNADVIVIDSVDVPEGATYTVDAISDAQQLQLTLPAGASGEIAFGYTISDGRGGTASATVRVAVRTPEQNAAPVQATRPALDVALGGRAELDLRGDWYDPDGDAFYLLAASTAAPDTVAFTPEGVLTYTDSGTATGAKEVAVTVSDGRDSAVGSVAVTVHPPAEVPLVAEGFVALVHVGQEVEIAPLEHVTGGSPALRLANVPAHDRFAVAPDYGGGTLRLTAQSVGEGVLDYAVTDGGRTASGTIRVIASLPPDANTRPVTVPHAAFARQNTSVLVDVLASDFDPAGGVLIVSGAGPAPEADGVRVEVIEQRLIRVTLTRPLETGSTVFGYTVTNGLAEASGTITVVGIPEPAVRQPPVAVDDSAAVRVGDVVDIPVLANDVHPDGDPLTLEPDLVREPAPGSGLVFTSGSVLRYLAPETPGDFTAEYRVGAPDGQWATGTVTISVREADPAANAAPVPALVTARVLAGETVGIQIPLDGIDPDGDSVQFLGVDSPPEKGVVSGSGTDWIEYTAGEYSAGTDTVSYTVLDRLGARATGTVRVGISARQDGARNPVATPDVALVRPGKTVLLRVLENDSDPDGGALAVTGVEASDEAVAAGATATVVDDMLSISTPAASGRFGFVYTIENARGGTSSSFATVEVTPDAPLARPVVSDTEVPLTEVLDEDTVDVDVLRNVFFAEGPSSELWLSVLPAYARQAQVVDGRVRVTVRAERQVIPFSVAHPDDPNVRATGFIWVPGLDDALPQLRPGAPALTVESGAALRIPLAAQVVAVGDRAVRISDPNSVRATHADGSSLVADEQTLVFRSQEGYFGPASISFTVADGTGADARSATLVLPVTVTPREKQPPVFTGAVLELEPGTPRAIDLAKLTTSSSGTAGLSYQVLDPRPAGVVVTLLGSTLTVSVDAATAKGTKATLPIGVSAGGVAGKAGRIELTVVSSTRPLAVPAADTVIAPRGGTTTVDVLANDAATNPFPQTPLRVGAVRGLDAGTLPAGLTVVPSADRSVLTVTAAPDAPATDVSVQYQVLDATGDPQRATWGSVRIAVQDRPGPVTGVSVRAFGDRTVTVSYAPGQANNAPITGFEVTTRTAGGSAVTTRCSSTSCVAATPGNGPANAVTVSVSARNGIGLSDAVAYSTPVWSDLLPGAPGAISLAPLDGGLQVRWGHASVPAGGSAITQYEVAVDGRSVATVDPAGGSCDGSGCTTTVGGLVNGSSATVTVTARNGAYPALAVWPSTQATGVPYGAPIAAGVTAVVSADGSAGTVTLSWPEFGGNGDPVAGYYVQQLASGTTTAPGGAQACTVSSPAPGRPTAPVVGGAVVAQTALGGAARSTTFTGLTAVDTSYPFVVWGHNAAGCAASPVVSAVTLASPGAVDTGAMDLAMVQQGTAVELQVRTIPTTAATSNPRYHLRQLDEAGTPVSAAVDITPGGSPRSLTGGAYGEVYRFSVQACNVWSGVEVCTPWSDPVAAPEPSITFAFASPPVYDGLSWSWLDHPANGSIVPDYYCGSRAAGETDDPAGRVVTPRSCTPTSPVAPGDAWLSLVIGGHRYVYTG